MTDNKKYNTIINTIAEGGIYAVRLDTGQSFSQKKDCVGQSVTLHVQLKNDYFLYFNFSSNNFMSCIDILVQDNKQGAYWTSEKPSCNVQPNYPDDYDLLVQKLLIVETFIEQPLPGLMYDIIESEKAYRMSAATGQIFKMTGV